MKDEAFDELEKAQQRKVATGVTDGSRVTIDRAKLEQVLEALEAPWNTLYVDGCDLVLGKKLKAITALKEALEDV